MDVRILKMADACSISGYTRDQMRALLRDLPSFTVDQGTGRSRVFTRVELLAIAVISFMEQRYGIKRAAIGTVVERLLETLQVPREIDPHACLVIVTGEASVSYIRLNEVVAEGLVVPLAPIFDRLDTSRSQNTRKADGNQLWSFCPTQDSSSIITWVNKPLDVSHSKPCSNH
jgi:hypothetical protein